MKRSSLVFAVTMFFAAVASTFAGSPAWVIGYYDPNYPQLCAVKDLPFSKLSLAVANVSLGEDGKLKWDAETQKLISSFPPLARAQGCRSILGIFGNDVFHGQVEDPQERAELVGVIAGLVKKYGYDGVDMDWERPKVESDKENFTIFSKELRKALPSPRYILTFDMTPSPFWDLPALAGVYDLIQYMGYDLHGSWSQHAGPNAPLYLDPRDKNGDWGESVSVDLAVQAILQAGAPPEKLILGVPFYGRRFSFGPYEKGAHGKETYLPYSQIQRDWVAKGWKRRWDAACQVPYLVKTGEKGFISYDDADSLKAKCRYAQSKGLAGVMIYAVGYDREPSGAQPLMDAVGEILKARR